MTDHPANDRDLRAAWSGRRVLLTGHTGFKGSWLTLWLRELGAEVTGLALDPDTDPSLFEALDLARDCDDRRGDVRSLAMVREAFSAARPDAVIHMAAQPLVRRSYEQPVETVATNVMGTAHVLDAVRTSGRPCAVVIVTSDKCYENREWVWGYREDEPMGGHDVYSMSKGAAELVTASYRRSFFPPAELRRHGVAVASARAGNVVGGGDWAEARIVPDCVRALAAEEAVAVRNPASVRPWQHVLEPLGAYLALGARLLADPASAAPYCEGWNFGPAPESSRTVRELVEALIRHWGGGRWEDRRDPNAPHEANLLRLSIEKAAARLGWAPRWGFDETMARTAAWYRAHHEGAGGEALRALSIAQIRDYMGGAAAR